MKQEHYLILVVGLILLAYLLDAVVNPLDLDLTTPYHYFSPATLSKFPFTTTSIALKAVALLIIPLWFMGVLDLARITRGIILVVISALLQLYAVQDIVSGANVVELEWSLAFTLAGMALLIPTIFFVIIGSFDNMHQNLVGEFYAPENSRPSSKSKSSKLEKLKP